MRSKPKPMPKPRTWLLSLACALCGQPHHIKGSRAGLQAVGRALVEFAGGRLLTIRQHKTGIELHIMICGECTAKVIEP